MFCGFEANVPIPFKHAPASQGRVSRVGENLDIITRVDMKKVHNICMQNR